MKKNATVINAFLLSTFIVFFSVFSQGRHLFSHSGTGPETTKEFSVLRILEKGKSGLRDRIRRGEPAGLRIFTAGCVNKEPWALFLTELTLERNRPGRRIEGRLVRHPRPRVDTGVDRTRIHRAPYTPSVSAPHQSFYNRGGMFEAPPAGKTWLDPENKLDQVQAPDGENTVAGTPPVLRMAAEWEPAIGVLVRWPPYLPRNLFVEFARETRLFVLVEHSGAARDAETWFHHWGIPRDRVTFIEVPGSDDAVWVRDYGPHPVFNGNGRMVLLDTRYDKTTPESELPCDASLKTPWNGAWGDRYKYYNVTLDDAAPSRIAQVLGLASSTLPLVLTGGNFLTDGRGCALSTCILLNENRSDGIEEEEFFSLARTELGLDRYTVVPNFEDDGLQHIDCLLKFLDERRILVARPPRNHVLYERYQFIVDKYLRALKTAGGQPYEILRIDTVPYKGGGLVAYTNSLILNGTVYVPLFNIAQDKVALEQWHVALPGYAVKGFTFDLDKEPAVPDSARRMYPDGNGWQPFDALHCRTRAVWDPGMLYVAVDPVPEKQESFVEYAVTASIVPYSGAPLLADGLKLYWRPAGESEWQVKKLRRGADGRFRASIPHAAAGMVVEYYVEAADASGRTEKAPRMAPAAVYRSGGAVKK
ncbi:MAG: agmatine deiminase family protein [Spirochaetales bacterium]|nr:agmatine deiminase family protein [Spirochaetales bacterium]